MKRIALLFLILGPFCANASIIYVDQDATGNNNGTSWTNAYTDLQLALAQAVDGDEIWVAEGVYKPTSGLDRDALFRIFDAVDIYGGFNGTETVRSQRNWNANETTLSGNIGNLNSKTDNSYRLIDKDNGAASIVDGFVIEKSYGVNSVYKGAVTVKTDLELSLIHCIIRDNEADSGPALIVAGTAILENCLITNNENIYGGIVSPGTQFADISLNNCTFYGNRTVEDFGVLFSTFVVPPYQSTYHIYNTIVWGNEDNTAGGGSDVETFNCILEDLTGYDTNINVLQDYPEFVNPLANDFSLTFQSPARNAGSDAYSNNNLDLARNTRVFDGTVDIGCYEVQILSRVYVDITANGADNGTSWTNAYEDLQDALGAALPGQEIWVADGIYKPTSTTDRTIAFEMPDDVSMYGGFSGTETQRSQRDWNLNKTILSGAIGSTNDPTDNSKTILNIANVSSVVDGFEIRRAYNTDNVGVFTAIEVDEAELTMKHCSIYENSSNSVAALYMCHAQVNIENCLFYDNHTFGSFTNPTAVISVACGAGSVLSINETTITQNSSDDDEAFTIMVIVQPQVVSITNSIIWDNNGLEVANFGQSSFSYCILEGVQPQGDNLSLDPLFVNPATNDFNLQFISPARNAGNAAYTTLSLDLNAQSRTFDGNVDIGCFESQDDGIIYVDGTATGSNDGSSWDNAFVTLNAALGASSSGYEIWVAQGTYKPTTSTTRDAYFTVPSNVRLYGGFLGIETQRNQRDWNAFKTILSGAIGTNADTDNSRKIIYAFQAEGIVIDGFDIRKAYSENAVSGALTLLNGSSMVRHCIIRDNFALQGSVVNCGGALSTTTFEECLFHDNSATTEGVFTTGATGNFIRLINCTVTRNSCPNAQIFGGSNNTTLTLENTIIWNHDGPLYESTYSVNASSCLLEDFDPANYASAVNIIDENPDFTAPGTNDFTLEMTSPAINSGDNSLKTNTFDLSKNDRLFDNVVDIGCYEATRPKVYFVDISATGLNNGQSWENAYPDINEALLNAIKGQEIWVAQGTYHPGNSTSSARGVEFTLPSDVPVYGGFNGTETSIQQRDIEVNLTILSGNVGDQSLNTDNSFHVISVDNVDGNYTLNGFVIEDSYANGASAANQRGGAINIVNANSVLLENCWIRQNYSLNHNVFCDNVVEGSTFINCIFQNNHSNDKGAAIGYETNVATENCAFTLNTCVEGVVYQGNAAAELQMIGSTFYGNVVDTGSNQREIIASVAVTGMKGQVANTIIWGNVMNAASKTIADGQNTLFDVDYSILQGPAISGFIEGVNVFYQDPLFVNPAGGDLTLQVGSKGLNGGNNSFVATTTDLLGNTRIQNTHVDMGCLESSICSRSNDHCFQAKTLTIDESVIGESITCATGFGESVGSCFSALGRSVWYTFEPQPGVSYTISVENVVASTASFNPRLEFFQGDCDNLSQIACADANGNGVGESIEVDNLGTVNPYYIRVSGILLQEGTYTISLVSNGTCTGDLDLNGSVGIADILIFNASYGCLSNCGNADLDGNGSVGVGDLLVFNSVFGSVCP